jgi:hypothetical protein
MPKKVRPELSCKSPGLDSNNTEPVLHAFSRQTVSGEVSKLPAAANCLWLTQVGVYRQQVRTEVAGA